jgi:DNA-binding NtrC family response regulator
MTLVLVVDDVPALAEQYAYDLKRLGGFATLVAPGGKEALELLAAEPVDCVLLDLEMPGVDGFAVLQTLRERGATVPVIVYTGTGDYDRCVRAVTLGAYAFIDKGDTMERVVHEVGRAIEHGRLRGQVAALQRRLQTEDSALVGSSAPMLTLKEQIAKLAPIPSPVLIEGESGSGKELVARDLHRLGRHPEEPFVALNAGALPGELVESELFGHERGAFTGAHQMQKGAFEAAGRGTLFLDEVGELPAAAQVKLLRVLEQREIRRVGGTRDIAVEARVVAATNRALAGEVQAGRFREDLLFRLNVHVIRVPPLRERLSDLPELTEHLLAALCERLGLPPRHLAPAALEALMAHDWRRNNVRELRNVLERMLIATDAAVLDVHSVPADLRSADASAAPLGGTYADQKAEAERRIIVQALERNQWHLTRTAKDLGLADHASLLKIMRRHGIERP